MGQENEKHVFVSYVHEDSARVDKLCAVLERTGIPYWRDSRKLGPGDAWKAKIRKAIRNRSLVFLACFSSNSLSKDTSFMNEELTLAVDEYRKQPPGRTWLIPVRFDAVDLPEWDLGAGRMLSDHHYVDLFGDKYPEEAAALVTAIHRLMGEAQLGPAEALEAVEQATAADRADLLRKMSKEMLLDPTRHIQLEQLVSQEVRRVLEAISDPQQVAGPLNGSEDQMVIRLATEAQKLWELTKPFCASLHLAGQWAPPDQLGPWARGVQSFVQAANKSENGMVSLIALRHLPGVVSVMTAGLACVTDQKWSNLKALVADATVRDRYTVKPIALLEATNPWEPFSHDELFAKLFARAAQSGRSLSDSLEDLRQRRVSVAPTPVAEWLCEALRPMFYDQLPDDEAYADAFDRAEVVLGVLAQDAVNMRIAKNGGQGWGRSSWFGRSTWRAARQHTNALEDLRHEFESQGYGWAPLRGELFGGDVHRAQAALDKYQETFELISRQSAFSL